MSSTGSSPALTVVIPTHDRPGLLVEAVESALSQTVDDLEVVVVDDGSLDPVRLAGDARLRVVRLHPNRGGAAARNAGLESARGRWVTYLDDDDLLLPHHAELMLDAWERCELPHPVGVVSSVAVVRDGTVLEVHRPPTVARGGHYTLEPIQAGRSFFAKHSLVVETEVLRSIGGWDASLRSRVSTDLFLRLNPVCSIAGLDEITYQVRLHPGPRVSTDPTLRQSGFARLVAAHQATFEAHPDRFADLLVDHAMKSLGHRDVAAAGRALLGALRRSPRRSVGRWRDVAWAGKRALRAPRSRVS